ncbi:WD repeat-containing protein 64 isoform X1 [Takifugu flavidus]|uniref:WD repeat-containing protein 64 isoform X1 n=1 Tax=Takifugu flavidus TaxID=433684 RepID=UPI0025449D6C|nr:WD repeat-containing protein 64 isoform X1 [Takifugu flavidus]
MPSGMKGRSSSASGRLEHQSGSSILSELGRNWSGAGPGGRGQKVMPEWLVRELLKRDKRRHSITLGDELQVIRQQRQHVAESVRSFQQLDSISCLTEETVSLDSLQKLKSAFEESRCSRPINVTEFGQILRRCLDLPKIKSSQIQGLFKKIDCLGKGRISWGDLCAYMLQESRAREDTARRRKQTAFALPATLHVLVHGVPVVGVHPIHDSTAVTVGEDGVICCWSSELKPQKTKDAFDGGSLNRKSKWASCCTLMTECNKLMIGTGDREIQFYDLSTLDPYCQINALETIPLTLSHSCLSLDKYCILYGDAEGCVTVILISCFGDTLRLWNKLPKIAGVPSVPMDRAVISPNVTFVRWKVHQDWVTHVKYYADFQAVVSSSNEESSSVVLGRVLPLTDPEQRLTEIWEACYGGKIKKVQLTWTPQLRASHDQTAFSINKGVKTFDLCGKHSLLVTGGLDSLVRMWNPHFSGKPAGILRGHQAPVSYLCISSEDSQIFSVSVDNAVKVWDIQEQHCLLTVDSKESGIRGDITACSYSSSMKSLYVAADNMAVLSQKTRPRRRGRLVSHEEPVKCCGYCEEFRQVVSCSEESVVRVWDFDTGRLVFEFGSTHAVTCMTFDLSGRRLITGGRDGCLRIWNYSNGQCLKTLKKEGECRAVLDCIFLRVHSNFYVMSVGQDRNVSIYSDVPADFRHVQKPKPSWQDDQKKGHKEEILCVAHCPPSLLATGSCDGEVIVWDVVSGRMQCRFTSPPPDEQQHTDGIDASVTSAIFLKSSELQQFSMATALVTSGAMGYINLWSVHSGGEHVGALKASRTQGKITKLAKTEKTSRLYAADQMGYIYIHDIKKFAPSQKSQKDSAENFWRAHTSRVTGLQVVADDQVVLTSSTDCSVRLWSDRGEFIGTFGQNEIWSTRLSSSWKHPAVPYEVLIDPPSVPNPKILNMETNANNSGETHHRGGVKAQMLS